MPQDLENCRARPGGGDFGCRVRGAKATPSLGAKIFFTVLLFPNVFFTVPPSLGGKFFFTVDPARGGPKNIYSSHAGVQNAAPASEQEEPQMFALPVAPSSWWTSLEPFGGCWGRQRVLTDTLIWYLQKQPSQLVVDKHQVLGGRSEFERKSVEMKKL